jgi:hypothetical protein
MTGLMIAIGNYVGNLILGGSPGPGSSFMITESGVDFIISESGNNLIIE